MGSNRAFRYVRARDAKHIRLVFASPLLSNRYKEERWRAENALDSTVDCSNGVSLDLLLDDHVQRCVEWPEKDLKSLTDFISRLNPYFFRWNGCNPHFVRCHCPLCFQQNCCIENDDTFTYSDGSMVKDG